VSVSPSQLGELLEVFEENFRARGELGASVSVWWRGEELLGEGRGWCERERRRRWDERTLVPVYSASKGPAAAALLLALDEHGLGVATPVCEVWPAFPAGEADFGMLLSHQCGLPVLDRSADLFDHAAVVAALEDQQPAWAPGAAHGYHPRTFGSLVDEPVRRLSGHSLGEFWRRRIAAPLGLEFWIGLPQAEWPRVAELVPGRASAGEFQSGFYREFQREGSLTRRAFSSPRGLRSVQEMNDPRAWAAGLPALGGIGTAGALAKFYQAAIGAIPSPLGARVRAALAGRRVEGEDRVLQQPTSFTAGCQMDPRDAAGAKRRRVFGESAAAFGHPGAGGSHAFGDPARGLSFAYTMNQMELSVMPGERCRGLVEALGS